MYVVHSVVPVPEHGCLAVDDGDVAFVCVCVYNPTVRWNFDDGMNGWAQSTAMEMGVEVDVMNGNLRGIVLPSSKFGHAFVDSPELRVELDAAERDYLVFRMKYLGQCELGMISLERNSAEPGVDPGPRRERTFFHDPVNIPFEVLGNSLDSDLYYIPIWKHVTGTIHRVRFHPCVASPTTADNKGQQFGQTFQIDWIAFAKGKLSAQEPRHVSVAHSRLLLKPCSSCDHKGARVH